MQSDGQHGYGPCDSSSVAAGTSQHIASTNGGQWGDHIQQQGGENRNAAGIYGSYKTASSCVNQQSGLSSWGLSKTEQLSSVRDNTSQFSTSSYSTPMGLSWENLDQALMFPSSLSSSQRSSTGSSDRFQGKGFLGQSEPFYPDPAGSGQFLSAKPPPPPPLPTHKSDNVIVASSSSVIGAPHGVGPSSHGNQKQPIEPDDYSQINYSDVGMGYSPTLANQEPSSFSHPVLHSAPRQGLMHNSNSFIKPRNNELRPHQIIQPRGGVRPGMSMSGPRDFSSVSRSAVGPPGDESKFLSQPRSTRPPFNPGNQSAPGGTLRQSTPSGNQLHQTFEPRNQSSQQGLLGDPRIRGTGSRAIPSLLNVGVERVRPRVPNASGGNPRNRPGEFLTYGQQGAAVGRGRLTGPNAASTGPPEHQRSTVNPLTTPRAPAALSSLQAGMLRIAESSCTDLGIHIEPRKGSPREVQPSGVRSGGIQPRVIHPGLSAGGVQPSGSFLGRAPSQGVWPRGLGHGSAASSSAQEGKVEEKTVAPRSVEVRNEPKIEVYEDKEEEEWDWSRCDICDMTFDKPQLYHIHIRTVSHNQKMQLKENKDKPPVAPAAPKKNNDPMYCNICELGFENTWIYDRHLDGLPHKQKLEDRNRPMAVGNSASGRQMQQNDYEYYDENEYYDDYSSFPRQNEDWRSASEKDLTPDDLGKPGSQSYTCENLKKQKTLEVIEMTKGSGKLMDEQLVAGIVTKKKRTLLIQNDLDACTQPLVGLDYMTEYQTEDISVAPRYVCDLCASKMDSNQVINHVTGIRHRHKYFKFHAVREYTILWHMKPKSEKVLQAQQFAANIENREGRHRMRLRVQFKPFEDNSAALKEQEWIEVEDKGSRCRQDLPGLQTFDEHSANYEVAKDDEEEEEDDNNAVEGYPVLPDAQTHAYRMGLRNAGPGTFNTLGGRPVLRGPSRGLFPRPVMPRLRMPGPGGHEMYDPRSAQSFSPYQQPGVFRQPTNKGLLWNKTSFTSQQTEMGNPNPVDFSRPAAQRPIDYCHGGGRGARGSVRSSASAVVINYEHRSLADVERELNDTMDLHKVIKQEALGTSPSSGSPVVTEQRDRREAEVLMQVKQERVEGQLMPEYQTRGNTGQIGGGGLTGSFSFEGNSRSIEFSSHGGASIIKSAIAQCNMDAEADAELALQISNVLTEALLESKLSTLAQNGRSDPALEQHLQSLREQNAELSNEGGASLQTELARDSPAMNSALMTARQLADVLRQTGAQDTLDEVMSILDAVNAQLYGILDEREGGTVQSGGQDAGSGDVATTSQRTTAQPKEGAGGTFEAIDMDIEYEENEQDYDTNSGNGSGEAGFRMSGAPIKPPTKRFRFGL